MFYWLATWLEALGGPALFRFLTSRSLFAFVTAFLLGLWVGRPIITWLYRKGLRSEERKYQALDTGSKKGTPVMGGLILLASGLGSALAWCDLSNPRIWVLIFAAIWFALVGGYDDYAKVRGGSAEAGMSRPVKLICQLGFGLALGFYIVWPAITPFPVEFAARFYVPFRQDALVDLAQVHLLPDLSLAWLYLLGSAVVIGYSTNAVNFTDGLDGLTTVPCLLAFLVLGIFAYVMGHQDWSEYLLYPSLPGSGEVTVFCSAMAGACLAFLWFNAYPADVFMGDTGSLMLGGVIATVALLIKQEVLLMLVGGLFVIEIASSFVQETFGIRRGRRLFSAAPLHHVFQNRGIAESKIVVRMWIVSVLFAAVALATLKIR